MKKLIDPDVLLLQAAADPTRLSILRQLSADGATCACDFTGCCGVSQPTVSHHLNVLRRAGIVGSERVGLWAYYYVEPGALEELAGWLGSSPSPGVKAATSGSADSPRVPRRNS